MTFDNRSRIFTEQSSVKIGKLDQTELYLFTYFGGEKVFITDRGTFAVIDLSTNAVHIHVTDKETAVGLPYLYNQSVYKFDSLPTEQPLALDARASGRCNYFQTSGHFMTENVIDIYDFCASSEKAPFLRQFLRRYAL